MFYMLLLLFYPIIRMRHAPKWCFRGMLCKNGAHLAQFYGIIVVLGGEKFFVGFLNL